MRSRTTLAVLWVASLVGLPQTVHADDAAKLAVAERFVSAFYAFEPEPLGALLEQAGDSKAGMLFYQGWAVGGNYIVLNRMPCEVTTDGTVSCSITVQDDLVMALGIDFDVTDTFTITVTDGEITAVETSSDDPQVYLDARDWVRANRGDWIELPCRGNEEIPPNPGECARKMLDGYRDYARVEGLTPRTGK